MDSNDPNSGQLPTAKNQEESASRPVQVKVDQSAGIVEAGGNVIGVVVHHADTVILDAGQAAAPPQPGTPPYKGLDFYDTVDASLFFGREKLTAELVAFVREHAFLAIVGASGSGKSSLARAGLIAALLGKTDRALEGGVQPPLGSRDWRYVAVTPTSQPFEALARALAGDGAEAVALLDALQSNPLALVDRVETLTNARGRLFLLVDQFEELFTLCKDQKERSAYIEALLAVCGGPGFKVAETRCTVIITVRADFYAQCIQYENFRDALATHQKPIGAMSRDELQRSIELPALAGQWAFQQGLVEQILTDVGDQPGNLPLLSYALLETWMHRSGRIMTLAGYQAAGGVAKAISQTADRVFEALNRQGAGDAARRIFLSLVDPGDEDRATRRREQLTTLVSGNNQSLESIALLALSSKDARLVIVDGEVVQISHEVLITAWPRLSEWLRTYRDSLQLLHGIRDAAVNWSHVVETEKQDLLTHRGGRLDDALELRDAGEFAMGAFELAYLEACVALRDRELAIERKRQRDRLRLITGAAAIFFILALLAGVLGFQSWRNANVAEKARNAYSASLRETIRQIYIFGIEDMDNRNFDAAANKLAIARQKGELTDPNDAEAVRLRGYIAKAFAQLAEGKGNPSDRDLFYAEAETLFTDSLRLEPDNEGAINGLGNVQYGLKKYDEAITSYLRAIELNPTYTYAYHDLALAYYAMRQVDPAQEKKWCNLELEAYRKSHELALLQPDPQYAGYAETIQPMIDSLEAQCK
jgi:tetratricopeptide (TPR) repeat protein